MHMHALMSVYECMHVLCVRVRVCVSVHVCCGQGITIILLHN